MHLSTITLRGFKSFPDPVEIRLEPGVAVVVGPNGSGKSNVADAIIWAAGSLSPSELRAEKPDDVLFAGAGLRSPADFCEVELLFDNADGDGPVDYSEVSIMRRLHRGGEGQYLVNRVPVRRTDIVELLADLGLGGSRHSIIGQGKVEEILASTAERRREFVEEAAGLGRFKRRRHRAELKLARVQVQVERARDVEEEVRKRLRPLALQATAAERAERTAVELATLRARIARLDLDAAEARLAECDERRLAAQLARRHVDQKLEGLLRERARAEDELADAAGGREAATAALYRLTSARERLALRREQADGLVEALRPPEEADLSALAERDRLTAELRGVYAELLSSERAARADLDRALERAVARRAAAGALERLRAAGERLVVRRESATTLVEALRRELADAEALTASGGPSPEQLKRAADEAVAAARAAAFERDDLAEQARLSRERLAALERCVAEREGLPPAARALAEEGERLALAELDVDPGTEKAVAAALGWRASALVAKDAASALELVERARARGLGSVAIVVGDRASELVRAAQVVSREELLSADRLSVTQEGHGYDPATGELWFAGEAAETVLLELEARRGALAAEADALALRARDAAERAARAAETAGRAEAAFAEVAPLLGVRRGDPRVLAGAVAAGERLMAALADLPVAARDPAEDLRGIVAAETHLRQAAAEASEGVASVERELVRLGADVGAEVEPSARRDTLRARATELAARRAEAVGRLPPLAAAGPRDPALLARLWRAAERYAGALAAAGTAVERLDGPVRARVDAGGTRTQEVASELRRLGAAEAELRREAAEAGERAAGLDVERARIEAEADEARRRLERSGAEPAEGDDREALEERAGRLERRLESLGKVNPFAKEEYEAEKARLEELSTQRADLETSLAELESLRAELTETVERRFAETFAAVARHFEEVAATLFPGGHGRLDLVEEGVEVQLRPAGKKITRLSLLSGGEKALGAISFLFALFLARPCPFYLLDEVEAALDDTNIGRFVELLRRYAERAQFVVITHQKRTMEAADVLYGVTMGADGVSEIVSRRLPQDERAALATA